MHATTNYTISFLLATLAIALGATAAAAGKDHCRTLKLDGSAGETSTDSVTFKMVDDDGLTVIDQSCQITVKSSEPASAFGERLPLQWYFSDPEVVLANPPCPTFEEALAIATKPNLTVKYPKKTCSESSGPAGPSCKIKYTYKVNKATLEAKKGPQLDICCYVGPGCKGTKWGSTDSATDNPVNLQVRNNNVGINFLPAPASLPAVTAAAADLVVDPIGIEQLPFPEVNTCRAEIAKDIEGLANKMATVLRTCHASPGVVNQADCNTISPASDPSGSVSTTVINLRQQVRDACSALGSPSKFSYGECPAPCAGVISPPTCVGGPKDGLGCRTDAECDTAKYCVDGQVGPPCTVDGDCGPPAGVCLGSGFCVGPQCVTSSECDTGVGGNGKCIRKGDGVCKNRCSAPAINVGVPCGVESDCDSVVGAGDGKCADWAEVADCAACLTRAAVENSFQQAFGPSGSPLSGLDFEAVRCKAAIADSMGKLQQIELKETRSCQAKLDGGKTALPAATKKCKDADPKQKRANAVAKVAAAIDSGPKSFCTGGVIGQLESCGGGDADLAAQCVVAAIKTVNQAYGISAIPDSRCGDAKRIGEECDDGNLINGDGCADDCTCEGICGDGVVNPLAVCGELCDDGNGINGDGCDNSCTPSPAGTSCGDGTVNNPGEQCDGGDDAACPGLCQLDCTCGGGLASPVTGDLTPCDPAVLDRYRFDVLLGETIIVAADTVDTATASDLCFELGSDCDTGDSITGDEDVPCTFPSPFPFDCPLDTFVASADGSCVVEVTECQADCANPAIGRYVLTVTRDGANAPLVLLNDNEPN